MDPDSNMTGVFVRQEETQRQDREREDRGRDGVMQMKVKEYQGLPATNQSWEREQSHANTMISDF